MYALSYNGTKSIKLVHVLRSQFYSFRLKCIITFNMCKLLKSIFIKRVSINTKLYFYRSVIYFFLFFLFSWRMRRWKLFVSKSVVRMTQEIINSLNLFLATQLRVSFAILDSQYKGFFAENGNLLYFINTEQELG